MQVVPEVLCDLGYDPADILPAAGIDLQLLGEPDALISFSSRVHLLRSCAKLTDCPDFGLRVGQKGGLSSFGLVGYLAMHSPNVGEALQNLIRHLHLHVQGASVALELYEEMAFLSYAILQPIPDASDQLEDAALAIMNRILTELCGPHWSPSEVWFCHRKPGDISPYRRYFGAPLRFDTGRNGLFFARSWLDHPVGAADPELHRLLQKQVDQLEAAFTADFPEQVRRVLHAAILSRHCRADQVAALFSIHDRTLHRRLKAHGTSFRELADDARFTIARQMLESSSAPLKQIAESLDYADVRAFSRAFKRWSGNSPARWRRQHVLQG
jgi:AraC-like DNA-binding protein